ncbi:hypothetical protein F5B17DRAFT_421741 [Nemania serpens]|nr:hypothetical protein F5B17DRAFT_421741 [Nemania serpens]
MEEETGEDVFYFVAPREKMTLSKKGTLREILFDGRAHELVHLFTVPVQRQYPASMLQARQGEARDALTLSVLPPEIQYLIFDHIELIEDVVCFGLTNQYFWTLARGYLDDYYRSFLGTWSGKNFVCVGEKVKPDDYPADLFSAEEIDELRPLRTDVLRSREGWSHVQFDTPFALSHFADCSVSSINDFVELRESAWRILQHCKLRGESKDPVFAARSWQVIPGDSAYLPQDQPWVLRNLTTKEFVRAGAIAIKPEYVRGPYIELVGFGEVLILRTCWSSSPSNIRINNDTTGPPRGVWAGHRFDITTLAKHESDIDSAEWSDVSDEVAREIAEIWRHEFGTDIREGLEHWYPRRPNRNLWGITLP